MTDASLARETRLLTKAFTANLTGRERGRDQGVRRNSYDVNDHRAQPWRRIGDGTRSGALDWIDALLQTAREFNRIHRQPGQRGGALGPYTIEVLEALLGKRGTIAIDFKSGRLDPAYDTLHKVTGYARGTIARALAKLKEHGFLNWVRRSVKTDNEGQFAPQREQTSNAYHFDFAGMAKTTLQRFRDLLEGRKRRRAARSAEVEKPAPAAASAPKRPSNPELAAALDRVGALCGSASSPSGLYPASGV